jgi:hypothetical protein
MIASATAVSGSSTSNLDWWKLAIEFGQLIAIIVGGVWALYLYRAGRRGEATVGIDPIFGDVCGDKPNQDDGFGLRSLVESPYATSGLELERSQRPER